MQKRPSHHFLHFTRKEKNGTLLLLFVICLLISTPFIYSLLSKDKNIDAAEFKNEQEALKLKAVDSTRKLYGKNYSRYDFKKERSTYTSHETTNAPVLFYFDPNTLSEAGWKKLGLKDKTIITIKNYLSKGGMFKQPADIKKIWGLHEDQVAQLLPYVRIEQTISTARPANAPLYEKKGYANKSITVIDINNADSSVYISLPGIGPGYAKRIIKFRDKLGGFYKIDQVSETFGLPDSTFQKIKNYLQVSGENIKRININTATLDELKEHPYIRYQLANAIIQYRTQHGNFESVEDIKKIMLVTDELFVKLSPYLIIHQ